ncbi:4-(cytidine 5'-diphospho)-2-C-methyl-D-erythritol kinase [Stenotrophomonas rhizophila]|uniref:4-(cytidine 5'-diphospho)-2-C-methyl-D-erythritol kinase n=1 Tax=Stenotrophomonas rhizophila TaxID=216778 RepID=UPI001E549F73|nr:4-(cytidine 5'-diphospho)-2-C-methyl-D-erythritol kinase [Stenotrophomonas rhizophila]MCC7634719.1 4-(cytidine 5'-diphospho)-2-C-methyl-D-erythritol kinase [Stenotrophomonas rhizophila]MCC7664909.1 4-(cytidine 5'-diphospho)-2-C-methyl-D-erythritol kinase [Stenotrophomonas rhizophila]
MSAPELNGGWSHWPAPAKLNLFLHITGRRDDGYHQLQTVFRLLDWGDTIRLRVRQDGRIRRDGASVAGVAEADDLAVRAAVLLKNTAKIAQGADIGVEKSIPAGGGFGGGSSDAATVLVALNRLWKAGLDVDALAALGLQLGADVPVFVRGHSAWAEGVGEQLTALALPPAWYVLADPGVHVPTAALFAGPDLTRDAPKAKIADFASGSLLGNAFEPVLRRREPAVEAVLAALSSIGRARLTGSGSGCFVEFATRTAAQQGLARLPKELRAWVAAGVECSPLLDVLERY